MALKIRVAGIPISISLKGVDFLKILNPTEVILIEPFLSNGAPRNKFRKHGFSVNFIPVRRFKRFPGHKMGPSLIKKIETIFPYTKEKSFIKVFTIFKDKLFSYYLFVDKKNYKKINTILNDNHEYSKITLNTFSCVIFNSRLRKADVIYFVPPNKGKNFELFNARPYHLNILKLFFRMILDYQKDGVLLHASSVEISGCGYVFIGPGGSGKSTVVKMLKPDRVFSDDATVIRKVNNSYKVFPNPWWNGKDPVDIKIKDSQKPTPLKAIFFIKRSGKTDIRKLDYKESLGTLIYRDAAFQQDGLVDNKIGNKEFYLFVQDLLTVIPAFELKIKKEKRFKKDFAALIKSNLKNN